MERSWRKPNLSRIFRELSRQIGIRKPGVRNGPRLHDFRHRFAIETLLRWYRRGESVPQRMPVLSTYLGTRERERDVLVSGQHAGVDSGRQQTH